jgi:Leucine-rich repeat (LRR) protein
MKLYKSLSSALEERDEVQALKLNLKEEKFPDEILNFPHLVELYLDGFCTQFTTRDLPWNSLKTISIKWEHFKGDLSRLFMLPALENIKIIDTPLKSFLLPLGHAASPLKSLTLKSCGLKSLPEEMSMLWQLVELNLSGNTLSSLPYSFIDLRYLKRLNLDFNHFSDFPDSIRKMPALSHLSIDNNRFSEEEKERIQREFHIWPN